MRISDWISDVCSSDLWDGEWYLRAFDDDGRAWGTSEEQECRIDSIAQSWSILSGAGDPERTERAIASARRHLVRDDDNIIRLLDPAFDRTPREPGYIKAYPPGIRENGGQYTPAAAWLAIAVARKDRKSVVYGKSVTVSVKPGGRRVHKKKK